MPESLEEIFKNIDFKTGVYKIKGLELKIRDLTTIEMETLQEKEAEINDLDGSELTSKEVLQKSREWQEFILRLAFGNNINITDIKTRLTAFEYKSLIEEVFVFLGRFTGPTGATNYMNTWKERLNSTDMRLEHSQ